MAELSSKLKALKFMQRKESATSTSVTASPQSSTLEENKAKLSASVRWFLEDPEYKTEVKRNFRVTVEQSGGQNRIGHSTFNDFKKKATGGDDNPESENKASGGDKEPPTTSPKQQPSHSVPKSQSPQQPPQKYKQSEERDSGGYKYSKHQQKSSPPSSSNRRNSMESEQSHSHHPPNPSKSSHQSRYRNGPEEDYMSNRRPPYNK
jgi:hypothetical protein